MDDRDPNAAPRKRSKRRSRKARATPVASPSPRRPAGVPRTMSDGQVTGLLYHRQGALQQYGRATIPIRPSRPGRVWRTWDRPGPVIRRPPPEE